MSVVTIELPDSLKKGVGELAARNGVSIEQFLVTALGEKVAAAQSLDRLRSEVKGADRGAFEKFLTSVPNSPPIKGDELP